MPFDDRFSKNRPRPSPLQTALIIAILILLVVAAGLFIYANWRSLVALGLS